jgi:uncharacterized iron-regulated protein
MANQLLLGSIARPSPGEHPLEHSCVPDRVVCRRYLLAVFVVAVLASCTGVSKPSWQSAVGREHRLVGRIWEATARRFVDEGVLAARLAETRYVLLGEKHDNADHHALQARMIRALTAAGRRPAVAFEMLTPSQARALAPYLAAHPREAAGIGQALNWDAAGWPSWAMYEPIAQAALDAGLPIVTANLDDERVRAVGRQGVGVLDAAFVRRHGLDQPLATDVREAMAEEIRDSHCGHAPEGRVGAMIGVQRARNAQMAEALLTAPGNDGAVLIAGAGHVRNDYGVPAYVRRVDPAARTVSIAFVEVDAKYANAESYAERFAGRMPFDYVWFTPAVDDEDPCEKFRKSLERLKR